MSALSTSSAKRQASTTKQYPDSKLKQTDSTENRTGETNAESIPYSIIPTLLVAVRYGNMGCGVFKIRKMFAKESTYSKEIFIPTTSNYL